MQKVKSVSIVVPIYNELKNVDRLIERIARSLEEAKIKFELIFIDDNSTDGTFEYLYRFTKTDVVRLYRKEGKKGKAYSLVEGFAKAKYEAVAMIDADLQYPPESLPQMLELLTTHDIVVAHRKTYKGSLTRRFLSKSFKTFFGRVLFGLQTDIQSGLKVFRREVVQTILFQPSSPWAFDLEFLHRAREAGYSMTDSPITFEERDSGSSKVKILNTMYDIGSSALRLRLTKISPQIIKPANGSMVGAGVGFKGKKYITHTTLPHSVSAMQTLIFKQKVFLFILLGVIIGGFLVSPLQSIIIAVAVLSAIYFIDVFFNLFIILKSLYNPQEIKVTDAVLEKLDDDDLPVYTILCPLYKESHIIPHFLKAIDKIDWPKNKLDVILLLEEDDPQAKFVVEANSPSYVRAVIVPHSMPKTKPKACNYGLSIAQGEYLVIYDAEDIPDADQLKKAYAVFKSQPKEIICLQAKLNYYNPHHNLLTRFFSAEYSLWFDLTLPGYQALNTLIPLGGTSNHFRTKDLQRLEGWDPFNVTEDADLGVRLFRMGYKTAIIDSTTLEEANSSVRNWLRQRSRWIKGYMQTYLVHMRHTFRFAKEHKVHALLFQLTVGGKLAFILINPLLWLTTIAYFTLYVYVGPSIEALYPPIVFYMAVASLVFGNFLFLYYYMIGCARREQWGLMKYVLLIPVYWLMISVAGFMALFQLIFKPHYWEKTIHGLHLKKEAERVIPKVVVATEETEAVTVFPPKYKQNFASRILKSKRLFGGGFLIVASMAANLGNLFFSTYFGRVLDPATLSVVALVASFWTVASILLNAAGATTNFRAGFLDGRFGKEVTTAFWARVRKRSFLYAGAISVVWLALSPFLVNYFQAENIYPFIVFLPVWLLGFAYFVDHGYLSGRLMFGTLGIVVLAETMIRVVSGLVLYTVNPSYVYISVPLSFVASFFIGWLLIVWNSRNFVKKSTEESKHFPKKFFFVSVLTGFSTMTFLTLDFLLAKHFLTPGEAGEYALLSTVGKMIFFLGSLGNQFILPLVSHDEGAKRNSSKTFYLVLIATFLLSSAGFVAFGLFGWYVLPQPFLFGERIIPVLPYLVPFGLAMLCFTVSRAFVTYYLAKRMYLFPIVASLFAVLQFWLISLAHHSIGMIVASMFVVGGLSLVAMIAMHLFEEQVQIIESNLSDFFGLFERTKTSRTKRNQKLRVLIFNWYDVKHVWAGGAEINIHNIAKVWVAKGYDVTMFTGNDAHSSRYEMVDGIQVVRRGGLHTVAIWGMIYYLLKFRGSYDVVIDIPKGVPFFTPLYVRKPILCLIHQVHQEMFRNELRFPAKQLSMFLEGTAMPFLYRNTNILTISPSAKTAIEKIGLGKKEPIHVVYPGVGITKANIAKTKHPSVIYLGRLRPYKNVDLLIKTIWRVKKEVPSVKLTIAGVGEDETRLKKLVKDLKLDTIVTFAGKVSESQKAELFTQSWVAIQPSMVEGWGITNIEANICGTAVIAANSDGLKDSVLHNKTGLLVEANNEQALATAIVTVLSDKSLRTQLEKNAIRWGANFSWEESADRFMDIIKKNMTKPLRMSEVSMPTFAPGKN